MPVLFIFVIMIMRVFQSLFNKKAALALPGGLKPYISYIAFSKYLAAGFALLLILPTMNFSGVNGQSVLIASCSGIALAVGSLCGIKSLLGGTMVMNSLFATAGMIIPIILGAIFFEESISLPQIICIGFLFIAIFLLVTSTKQVLTGFSLKTLIYLVGSFLSNGAVMFCQKLFGILQPCGNVSMFSMFTFLIPSLVLTVVLLIMKAGKVEPETTVCLPKRLVLYSVILAFAVFVIQQLVTILTLVMSSAVLFSLVNGGATVISAIVGATVYKEKINLKSGIGIALGIISLILIKVFE